MKKLLVVLCVVFMYACTSEEQDGGSNKESSGRISPPAWIQGKWKNEKGVIIEFTKSDLSSEDDNGVFSASYEINYWEYKGYDPEVVETQTPDSYAFEYLATLYDKKYFNFIKISETQIESKKFYKGIYTKM